MLTKLDICIVVVYVLCRGWMEHRRINAPREVDDDDEDEDEDNDDEDNEQAKVTERYLDLRVFYDLFSTMPIYTA